MLADALVQYLVVKRWTNLLLVVGRSDGDREFAADIRHAALKFQAHIVEEKPWTFIPGARRTDTGHFAVQAEVARFTQGISYDVLVVADEDDEFGDDLSYRTFDPRPVAGTQGLVPSAWARPHEQWGATQLQDRFLHQAKRWMTDRDYAAWMAVRAVGEAAARTQCRRRCSSVLFCVRSAPPRAEDLDWPCQHARSESSRPWAIGMGFCRTMLATGPRSTTHPPRSFHRTPREPPF
jgi:ABC transporter substrate binding protein (PQQ-dependent alcohol dehydrogenase system)